MKTFMNMLILAATAVSLTSCAAGSLTAGYAARANQADQLTPEGEYALTSRIKEAFLNKIEVVPVKTK